MSLARVDGDLTEWTTNSKMSSGAHTAAGRELAEILEIVL